MARMATTDDRHDREGPEDTERPMAGFTD